MSRILIIEDEARLRESIVDFLRLRNYQVESAPDGQAGLKAIRFFQPNLVICDIMMPMINGYQVLEKIRQEPEHRNIPFIFLSAKAEPKDIRRGMNLSADDYITKPFSLFELNDTIETRLNRVAQIKDEIHETLLKTHHKISQLAHRWQIPQAKPKLEAIIEDIQQLLQKQKEKIDRFSFYNSHKVRAPLSRIMGLVSIMKMDYQSPEAYLNHLHDSAEEMDQVLRELAHLLEE